MANYQKAGTRQIDGTPQEMIEAIKKITEGHDIAYAKRLARKAAREAKEALRVAELDAHYIEMMSPEFR